MKKILLMMAFVLIASASFQSCKKSDESLKKEVDKVLVDPSISYTVKDGIVTLTGEVESPEQKTAAEQIAKAVKGIKSVVNNVTVKEKVAEPVIAADDVIKSAVETALQAAGFKDVKIEVLEGVVTLTGDIKKDDLAKIMQIANEANPKKVENKLNLK